MDYNSILLAFFELEICCNDIFCGILYVKNACYHPCHSLPTKLKYLQNYLKHRFFMSMRMLLQLEFQKLEKLSFLPNRLKSLYNSGIIAKLSKAITKGVIPSPNSWRLGLLKEMLSKTSLQWLIKDVVDLWFKSW